jgi:hypothetical protein
MWWWNSQIEETPEDPSAEYVFTHIHAHRKHRLQVRISWLASVGQRILQIWKCAGGIENKHLRRIMK